MLNGAASGFALCHHCAARGVYHILGYGFNYGFALKVYALYFIAMIFRGGIKCHRQTESSVQPLAIERETAGQCLLF